MTTLNLLCFLECLQYNGVKHTQMANYLSAVKTKFLIMGLDVTCFNDCRLKYYQKAILQCCDLTYMGQIFKAVYLTSFFSFLRLSNLVPHSTGQFSQLKHLARGDVVFSFDKVVILLKWSKTMQCNNGIKLITIPRISNSILCPVTALANLLTLTPKGSNLPLFQVKVNQNWVPLTDTKVRRHFSLILNKLHLGPGYTFHTFRRSGATFAFTIM